MLKILHYDFPCIKNKERNPAIIIITAYIVELWLARDIHLEYEVLKGRIVGKIIGQRCIVMKSFGNKCNESFCKKFINLDSADLM